MKTKILLWLNQSIFFIQLFLYQSWQSWLSHWLHEKSIAHLAFVQESLLELLYRTLKSKIVLFLYFYFIFFAIFQPRHPTWKYLCYWYFLYRLKCENGFWIKFEDDQLNSHWTLQDCTNKSWKPSPTQYLAPKNFLSEWVQGSYWTLKLSLLQRAHSPQV